MTDIDHIAQQFRDARVRAASLAGPLSPAQFNWRAHRQAWSVAECLTHLTVTARAVQASMRRDIALGRARGLLGAGPFRYGWFSRWFEREMEPPPKRRMKAPQVFAITTGSTFDTASVLGDFEAVGATWLELVESTRGLDLQRVKVVSPAARFLRFPLGAYLGISTAHERRHLWQAEQVVAGREFPRA